MGFIKTNEIITSKIAPASSPGGTYGPNAMRYAAMSTAQALKDRGYIGTIASDPSNSKNSFLKEDYILMRCDKQGAQSFDKNNDASFSIVAVLERSRSFIEEENSLRACSGPNSSTGSSTLDYGTTTNSFQLSTNYSYGQIETGSPILRVGNRLGAIQTP